MYFCLVAILGHINPNNLFKVKTSLYIYIFFFFEKKTTKPITKDYKFISILLRIFEIFKNTKNN